MIGYLVFQFFVITFGGFLCQRWMTADVGLSFVIGGSIVLVNLLVVWTSWSFLFRKKLIALGTIIIVFKYAILWFVIDKIMKIPWINSLWVGLGLGIIMITCLISSIKLNCKDI